MQTNRIEKVATVLICSLVLLSGLPAFAQNILAQLSNVRPTQMQAGWADARKIEAKFEQEAVTRTCGLSEVIVADFKAKPFPAIKGPDGVYYISDGHHRVLAAAIVVMKGRVREDAVEIPLHLIEDDSGLSWPQFAQRLREQDIGYFTPEVRKRIETGEISLAEAYQHYLPHHFQEIQDDLLRSAIGEVFFQDRVHGGAFVNYIEFRVGELIKDRATVAPGTETDPATLDGIRRVIWGSPDVIAFLKQRYHRHPDPQQDAKAKASVAAMVDAAVGAFSSAQTSAGIAQSTCGFLTAGPH